MKNINDCLFLMRHSTGIELAGQDTYCVIDHGDQSSSNHRRKLNFSLIDFFLEYKLFDVTFSSFTFLGLALNI